MDEIERMLAERACERLCLRFHALVDAGEYEPIVDLFAEDARWHHRTGPLQGHDEIRRYVMDKSPWPVIRHVLTNLLVEVLDERRATGRAYITVYYGEPVDGGHPPLDGPVLVVQYDDEFERTPQGWRFSSRRPQIVFKAPAFANMVHTLADERARKSRPASAEAAY